MILVVWFISLLYNVIEKSPIVFLKLAEDSVAEIDMVRSIRISFSEPNFQLMIPDVVQGAVSLNFTELGPKLDNVSVVVGAAPRWVLYGNVENVSLISLFFFECSFLLYAL